MKPFNYLMALTAIMCLPVIGNAQSVEDLLSKYTSENGQKYLQPFADAFSANLNSGLFHNAKIKKAGFQLYLGVETPVAMIGSSQKTMTATTEGDYFPKTTVDDVPTIFGPTEGKKVEDPQSGLVYVFPGGFDVDALPMVMPQLTIGSLFGTDFTLRYAQVSKVEDLGTVKLFGWGVRHSIDQYLKLPINLAVGYYRQKFDVGDYMSAQTNTINAQASYSIPIVTFYGGLGYQSGKVDIGYEYIDPQTDEASDIRFNMTPANTVLLTLGIGFDLGPFNLHGDYNLAQQSTYAVGLGLSFGEK